jgi:hypothetical protein
MNSKRKADLQRKLSLAPVARPPAGLVDRLKQDIPNNLKSTAEEDRQRLSSSIGFNLRVAASILLMISGLYLTLHLLSGSKAELAGERIANSAMPPAKQIVPHVTVTPASAPVTASQPMVFALAETTVVARADRGFDQRNEKKQELQAGAAVAPVSPAESVTFTATSPAVLETTKDAPAAVAESSIAKITAAPMVAEELAPPPPMAMPPPPMPMAAPPPPAPVADAGAANTFGYGGRLASRDLIQSATAADLSFAPPDALFGISVDRRVFDRIKSAIEHGERPDSTSINVDALVNYFAGPPPRAPREVKLEAEGSPAPVPGDELRQIVRVTVDTATTETTTGSVPPIAADAVLDVRFDPHTVATHRRIGGNELSASAQPSLLKNASVTALYELELLPNVQPRQEIATVQLTYRSVTDGREQKLVQTLQRRDLARTWKAASRRHRLASLGAVWGETLKSNAGGLEIARRAEELAHQAPHDEKARELADVASASSRLHASAAAGSAR